jgi:hypothetical protein
MSQDRNTRSHTIVIGMLACLPGLASCLWLIAGSVNNGRPFVYALDDAYIHMALSKTLDQFGVYGLTQYESSSPSSSYIWPFLLLGLRWLGIIEYGPLVLNIAASLALSVSLTILLKRLTPEVKTPKLMASVALIIMIAPMPALVLGGMEHLWHGIFCLIYVFLVAEHLSRPTDISDPKTEFLIMMTAFIACALRIETIFLTAIICCLYAARKNFRFLAWLVLASSMPILIFAIYSLSQDGYIFPHSVLIKSKYSGRSFINLIVTLFSAAANLKFTDSTPILPLLLWHLAMLLSSKLSTNSILGYSRMIFLGATALHVVFADSGWLMRYESYLLITGLACAACDALNMGNIYRAFPTPQRPIIIAIAMTCLVGSLWRIHQGVRATQLALKERQTEHWPAAQFVRQNYDNTAVVIGDVGMIAFQTDVKIYDVLGLSIHETCREILDNRRSTGRKGHIKGASAEAWRILHSAKIAIIKDDWILQVPDNWIKVGRIKIRSNIVFRHFADLNFYAFDIEHAKVLSQQIANFNAKTNDGQTIEVL